MMPGPNLGSLSGLVDVDKGLVSREIFVNEEIYRQELERVFARAWLFIGHESQIPRPGDYLVSSMGEDSVILCRDPGGRVHVFLNSCRHRGMKVCRYDEGHMVEFMCPYHGWSYATFRSRCWAGRPADRGSARGGLQDTCNPPVRSLPKPDAAYVIEW